MTIFCFFSQRDPVVFENLPYESALRITEKFEGGELWAPKLSLKNGF